MSSGSEREPAPVRARRSVSSRIGASARKAGSLYLGAVVGDVAGPWSRLKDRATTLRGMLRPSRARFEETFAEAQYRLRLSEADLATRQRALERLSYAYLAIATTALLLLVWAPWTTRPLSQFIVSFAVLALCLSRGAATRFRRAQIESRELFGFVEWLFGHKGRY